MFAALILLAIFVPAISGIGIKYLKTDRRTLGKISLVCLGAAALCALACLFLPSNKAFTLMKLGGSVRISFSLDPMNRFYIVLVGIVWVMVGLYAIEYTEHDENMPSFFRWYLLSFSALVGLSASANLITLYMFYELMTLLTVPLVAHNRDRESVAAALKYLLYSVFGASAALLGVFFVASYAGTTDFIAGGVLNAETVAAHANGLRVVFFIMILGFGVKAGMFPTHSWLPTAHPVAPAPASAVLSGVITKMGVLGIIRTVFYISGVSLLRGTWVQYTFMALTLVTVVMGSTLAFKEKLFKKRLAYSTVSQVSYVLFGLSTMTEAGFIGACLHIVFHSLIKNTLFMSAGAVIHKAGLTKVDELTGIGKRMPFTMTLFTVASLGLIGIPPTGGFVSKWNLASGALATGFKGGWIGPACLLLSAILTAAYLMSISIKAFFTGEQKIEGEKCEAGWRMLLPMALFACLSVVFGIFASPLIKYFASVASVGQSSQRLAIALQI
ncbi:MAG: proton-conducting membrane transporter [Clostridia bacterium]|nr:proton-conducting membrane transporter [Clostridia bacterium]